MNLTRLVSLGLFFISLSLMLPYSAFSSREFYTVQTASFVKLEDARNHYSSVMKTLDNEVLDYLRIEKIGDYFSIRIGKFEESDVAHKHFLIIRKYFPAAIMRKAYINEERIKFMYSPKRPVDQPTGNTHKRSVPENDISRSWVSVNLSRSKVSASDHEKNGDLLLKSGEYFRAAEEFRFAIDKGLRHPVTYWKLSEALYEIKFVDEAIVELEKAVELSQLNDVLKIELAKLYLVKDRLEDAQKMFMSALKINPSSANIHYYLGEVFLRMGEYDMAWIFSKAASGLGHWSENLNRKLSLLSQEPEAYPWDNEHDFYIRQILVYDEDSARKIMKRIADGELFEDVADAESMIPGKPLGGYMGRYTIAELHPKISEALVAQKIFDDPVIVQTENGFHIVQRVANFDLFLEEQLLAGSE